MCSDFSEVSPVGEFISEDDFADRFPDFDSDDEFSDFDEYGYAAVGGDPEVA